MPGRPQHTGHSAKGDPGRSPQPALRIFKVRTRSRLAHSCSYARSTVGLMVFALGRHDWGQEESTGSRRCPMCLEVGPVVTLCMGIEPAFYVDSGPPTYAFNPCGHMATEKTVK